MNESGYELVIAIVKRGKGVEAISAATESGARGATLLSGRGSGYKEAQHIFGLSLEPEKDVVIIACAVDESGQILKSIDKEVDFKTPGNGLGMILPIRMGIGLNKLLEK